MQLFEVWLVSPEAETIESPGAQMSGFLRPSAVGPCDENDAIEFEPRDPFKVAPIARMSFAVAGEPTDCADGPAFPFAKTMRKSSYVYAM